jgi:hypothetical protein
MALLSGCREQRGRAVPDCALVTLEYVESFDISHGGSTRTGRIEQSDAGYDVILSGDVPFPERSGEPFARPWKRTLVKRPEEVRRFLRSLVSEHKIHEFPGSAPEPIGLHPTFTTLRFEDSCRAKGEVKLVFEGHRPGDRAVRSLVEAVRTFFEEPPS